MKCLKFFITFCLCIFPFTIHAGKHHKDKHSKEQALIEQRIQSVYQHITEINRLANEIRNADNRQLVDLLSLFKQLLAHCNHSINIFSEVSNSIKSQKNTSEWKKNALKYCDSELSKLRELRKNSSESINQLEITIATNRCQQKYTEGVDIRGKVSKRFTNIDEVVQTLNQASLILEQAISEGKKALAPMQDQQTKASWLQFLDHIEKLSKECKNQAQEWPNIVSKQKKQIGDEISRLQEESIRLENEGLNHRSREALEQAANRLMYLIETGVVIENDVRNALNDKLEQSKDRLAAQLLELSEPILTFEEFKQREAVCREDFYQSLPRTTAIPPRAIPLDGQTDILYVGHSYRYLVQRDDFPHEINIEVFKEGQIVHKEVLLIPSIENSWSEHPEQLITISNTCSNFGLELSFSILHEPYFPFSMIIEQKAMTKDFDFQLTLDDDPLYDLRFTSAPPWQLNELTKPYSRKSDILDHQEEAFHIKGEQSEAPFSRNAILDRFVSQWNQNPVALARYVYNEIELIEPFLRREKGRFQAPAIQRSSVHTFIEKQGSPWEQCVLLVDLLKHAGYQAYTVKGTFDLPAPFVEKLLGVQLPGQLIAQLDYPAVVVVDRGTQYSLFPWMKEIEVHEGYDLYSILPKEYRNADLWLKRYLCSDEEIFKHLGPDNDDTVGKLFPKFVATHLRNRGMSLDDIGMKRNIRKKQEHSWIDFLRPLSSQNVEVTSMKEPYAQVIINIISEQNPHSLSISLSYSFAELATRYPHIYFTSNEHPNDTIHFDIREGGLSANITGNERDFTIKIFYLENRDCNQVILSQEEFSIVRGTAAALCFQSSGSTAAMTSVMAERFEHAKDQEKLPALLSLVGMAYFEKCFAAEKTLAALHKVLPATYYFIGLAKLSPETPYSCDLRLPQVDMHLKYWTPPRDGTEYLLKPDYHFARHQCRILANADASANEHQVIREVYQDPYAISTIKLLQIAHQEHMKSGLEGTGFLAFTRSSFEQADKNSMLVGKSIDLVQLKQAAEWQWNILRQLFTEAGGDYMIAYMTPRAVSSLDGFGLMPPSYTGYGTLFHTAHCQGALISNGMKTMNGGFGSRLPNNFLDSVTKKDRQIISQGSSYTLISSKYTPPPLFDGIGNLVNSTKETPSNSYFPLNSWWMAQHATAPQADVRMEHKRLFDHVADPVDVIKGAFYSDETDITLPGIFPLEIRRNYNSQNPQPSNLGVGWKLSLNPYLIEEGNKLYVAEQDGTVIVYCYQAENNRWIVLPQDNPDLRNANNQGQGGLANPFHLYIEKKDGFILHGVDGSKRIYHNNKLTTWSDGQGNTLTFSYEGERLIRITNGTGGFLSFGYNYGGKIAEAYSHDGRRVTYSYDGIGNLTTVTLPNGATVMYEYDRFHRVIRETKPHGVILENVYDEKGRVIEQHSPVGIQQQMIISASFAYEEGCTKVTDGRGNTTIYRIFDKQIYQIIDPLGFVTLQSWFIDAHTYLDAESGTIQSWNAPGGWKRSLKSIIDKRGLRTEFIYDARGNIECITLRGDDLTGSGLKTVSKHFAYNERNQCIEEQTLNAITKTEYDTTYPYLPRRVEKFIGEISDSFIELEYFRNGLLKQENNCGSITEWEYDLRGFPTKKTQKTGTDDPDVVTMFQYNDQGQCVELITADAIQHSKFDIMGNCLSSTISSPSGNVKSKTYYGYNLNNKLVWKQGNDPHDVLFLDYNAAGLLKATRKNLSKMHNNSVVSAGTAYTLYEYDACGNLLEQVDALGNCIYNEYDPLGRILRATKGGLTTEFTYEAGGLLLSMTSPGGSVTTRCYTTSGQCYSEIQPDGSTFNYIYDLFGRRIEEIKYGISTFISYNDATREETYNCGDLTTIRQVDARGNLISYTDAAGYVWTKTYDALNRVKSETDPNGEMTRWNYHGNTVTSAMPNCETCVKSYVAGSIEESRTFDLNGTLIAESRLVTDLAQGKTQQITGDVVTTTWVNTLGHPISIQQGNVTTIHHYDAEGNCISTVDGEGHTTLQEFDSLGRLVKKQLSDGANILYEYDADSHLVSTKMPDNLTWKSIYDPMGRTLSEWQEKDGQRFQQWDYIYQNGLLSTSKDPMGRFYHYAYDTYGRLLTNVVGSHSRHYTYDPRGLLTSAVESGEDTTKVDRSYDAAGRLVKEIVSLNGQVMQLTEQQWTPFGRTLRIGDHQRDFVYQNGQLKALTTNDFTLSYNYATSGSLIGKTTPFSDVAIQYNASALPQSIDLHLADGNHREVLQWKPTGKLSSQESTYREPQVYQYTPRGFLQSAGEQTYTFDFGMSERGVRTSAPNHTVSDHDSFGRIAKEIVNATEHSMVYDGRGQITAYGDKQFKWDPWGRLTAVTTDGYTWTATYDAFGRRLKTSYATNQGESTVTQSHYDPEHEFQEIGFAKEGQMFWKLYGPTSCDALIGTKGDVAVLHHDVCNHLIAVTTSHSTHWNNDDLTPYGPRDPPKEATDLISYALSFNWHSACADPTGLIWLGARYYDPANGRFLSPDPISFPFCLDLYAYANGDPINNVDPDGRFATAIYDVVKPITINALTFAKETSPLYQLKELISPSNPSRRYDLSGFGRHELPNNLFVTNLNGMGNTFKDAQRNAMHISDLCGGCNIHSVYGASLGIQNDVLSCCLGMVGVDTGPPGLLRDTWKSIFDANPDAYILHFPHSRGCIETNIALSITPQELRSRIVVVAIAPGGYIDNRMCASVTHYRAAGSRDFVPLFDFLGARRQRDTTVILPSAHNAPIHDHDLISPTYKDTIEYKFKNFKENYVE